MGQARKGLSEVEPGLARLRTFALRLREHRLHYKRVLIAAFRRLEPLLLGREEAVPLRPCVQVVGEYSGKNLVQDHLKGDGPEVGGVRRVPLLWMSTVWARFQCWGIRCSCQHRLMMA